MLSWFGDRYLPYAFRMTCFRSGWLIALLYAALVGASLVGGMAVAEEIAPRRVVFFFPDSLEPSLSTAFEEALRAHFADVDVVLTVERVAVTSFDFREIIEKSKASVKDDRAVGVFWLDTEESKDWLLYLVDPKTERALARRVRVPDERESAGAETVAVIASNATSALIDGREINPQLPEDTKSKPSARSEVTEEFRDVRTLVREESTDKPRLPRDKNSGNLNPLSAAPAKIPAEPLPRTEGREEAKSGQTSEAKSEASPGEKAKKKPVSSEPSWFERYLGGRARIALAYSGNTFADERPWQSGLGFWAGWMTNPGLYGGVGYLLVQSIKLTPESPEPIEGAITVQRYPIEVFFGHRYRNRRFSAYFEGVGIFDLMVRRTGSLKLISPQESARIEISKNKTTDNRLVFGLSARFILEYTIIGDIAIFAGLAGEGYFGSFDYKYQPEIVTTEVVPTETILGPRKYRANVEVGLSFCL